MECRSPFEQELRRRGIAFSVDQASGRYAIRHDGVEFLISLENLERGYLIDQDQQRVVRYVDAVLKSMGLGTAQLSADRLYWSLEPNDYEKAPPIRSAISKEVDRVLVHVSADGDLVTWVMPDMLAALGVTENEAASRASANLARELASAEVVVDDVDGVPLAYLSTQLPFKSALMLAPNLKDVVGERTGWPLLAVVPDRDFLYLWSAKHRDFTGRLGGVVVREFSQAPYPISTEVYEIGDAGLRAIGAFPKPDSAA